MQEIMLDLVTDAANPTAIAVTVGCTDVNLFATERPGRSYGKDAGVSRGYRLNVQEPAMRAAEASSGMDHGKAQGSEQERRILTIPPAPGSNGL